MSRPREFDAEHALEQCMEVFWTKGYKSTSFDDLTRRTQVKKQSLYCLFDDKRALFLKALALYREQSLAMLEDQVSRAGTPVQKLEAIRDTMLFQGDEALSKGCFMVNSTLEFGTGDEKVTREVEIMFAGVECILEKVIRSGQEQGCITNRHTAAALAAHLATTLLGAQIMAKSGASRERIDTVWQTSFALILA
ncbi:MULTISPECIES: TetR/AcrR family transcriptional regulator [Paenibacillus]|uniref:TetR/AcrR family transcriptional regulator n=1 Tax=Paenibacillus TaxID=44249 RepID=UPI0022B907ED|nr:TetR/AcrR family transcriptional regulator [Paenibacillus caseinilyticus]MCZ8519612.1 TetR/AcrR family transcriptional regulator [Paenibacillus caseinilyticus]